MMEVERMMSTWNIMMMQKVAGEYELMYPIEVVIQKMKRLKKDDFIYLKYR